MRSFSTNSSLICCWLPFACIARYLLSVVHHFAARRVSEPYRLGPPYCNSVQLCRSNLDCVSAHPYIGNQASGNCNAKFIVGSLSKSGRYIVVRWGVALFSAVASACVFVFCVFASIDHGCKETRTRYAN